MLNKKKSIHIFIIFDDVDDLIFDFIKDAIYHLLKI